MEERRRQIEKLGEDIMTMKDERYMIKRRARKEKMDERMRKKEKVAKAMESMRTSRVTPWPSRGTQGCGPERDWCRCRISA